MHHIDYGLGHLRRRARSTAYPADEPFDLAAVYQALLAAGQLAGVSRCASASTRSARPRASRRRDAYLAAERRSAVTHELTRDSICRRPRRSSRRLDAAAIERDGRRPGRACARAAAGCSSSASAAAPATASHAVNDFRKLAGFEAYAPTDNVSELTARTNDEGWETVFAAWLTGSRLRARGRACSCSRSAAAASRRTSARISCARCSTRKRSAPRSSASSAATAATRRQVADACVIVPTVNPETVTPHTEAFQAVVWHLLVSHPALKARADEVGIRRGDAGRAVFLDRDGVLNRAVVRDGQAVPARSRRRARDPARRPRGAARGCKAAGFALVVVTNQPDVARGTQTRESGRGDQRAPARRCCRSTRSASAITTTPTAARAGSRSPGLLLQPPAAIDLAGSFMVGDRWRDIEAGPARRLPGDGPHRLRLRRADSPADPTSASARWRRPPTGFSRTARWRSRHDAPERPICARRSSPTAPTSPACSRCTGSRTSRASRPTRR